jgi:hypothetical protein
MASFDLSSVTDSYYSIEDQLHDGPLLGDGKSPAAQRIYGREKETFILSHRNEEEYSESI